MFYRDLDLDFFLLDFVGMTKNVNELTQYKSEMTQMETGSVIKFVFIGDADVGKTSLVLRFVEDKLPTSTSSTVGVEFNTRVIQIEGKVYFLQMWDTAGQERYRSIVKSYFKGAHGIFFIFDLTNRSSLKGLDNWITEVDNTTDSNAVRMLVGNKKDKEQNRQVTFEEGLSLAQKLKVEYHEASIHDRLSVDKVFDRMVKLVLNQYKTQLEAKKEPKNIIMRKEKNLIKKNNCC